MDVDEGNGAVPGPTDELEAALFACLDGEPGAARDQLERLQQRDPLAAAKAHRLLAHLDAFGLRPDAGNDAAPCISDYRLLRVLGSGGMGIVHLAEHRTLGRRVALKVVHGVLADTQKGRERFRREALAIARVDHPGICPVYEAGTADGVPFLAMRFLPGASLQRHIADSRAAGHSLVLLPRQDGDSKRDAVLRLCERIAQALHAAHDAGLVHRDVKPGNVLVSPDGQPVLVDFGLARLEGSDDGSLTLTGDLLGTPSYMAPEQILGQQVDRRADVFALGVVLYECLTLRLPFDAPNRHDLQSQILHDDPPDPRRRQRAIDRELWTVLQTALAKDPAHRYRSAAAFAEDLRRVRCHEPILAQRASPWRQLLRFGRRHPVVAGFVAVLTVALLVTTNLLQQRDAALGSASRALRTARANEQALLVRAHGQTSPPRGIAAALQAIDLEDGVATRSALAEAVIACRERARLQHGNTVWSARFSADGQRVLTCSDDNTARLWTLAGDPLQVLRHDHAVEVAEFLPSGCLLTASRDATVRVWTADGDELLRLDHRLPCPGIEADRTAAATIDTAVIDPNGAFVATATDTGLLQVWSLTTGTRVGTPFVMRNRATLAWSPDGTRLAAAERTMAWRFEHAASFAVTIYEIHAGTLTERHRLENAHSMIGVRFAPSGDHLLVSADVTPQSR